jgi:hypothetical protein
MPSFYEVKKEEEEGLLCFKARHEKGLRLCRMGLFGGHNEETWFFPHVCGHNYERGAFDDFLDII